uniref:Uncharacterized protein n=1 Tax=Vibrio tasmaniensis TaxID=212663 RepID=A0A0H4A1A1_9VIBR|nr:hypothetical protein [Vibrio tasmaniensis]
MSNAQQKTSWVHDFSKPAKRPVERCPKKRSYRVGLCSPCVSPVIKQGNTSPKERFPMGGEG